MIDISKDLPEDRPLNAEQLTAVINAARDMMKRQLEIAELESKVKRLKGEYFVMETETLPNLMESIDRKRIPLANGYNLEVESIVRASLPSAGSIEDADDEVAPALMKRRLDGLNWLKSNKAQSIIRDEMKIILGKGQGKFAKLIAAVIRKSAKEAKADISIERKETVHPATLSKYIKEKLEAGAEVPLDTFAVFNGKLAKIIPPKKEKKNDGKTNASEK